MNFYIVSKEEKKEREKVVHCYSYKSDLLKIIANKSLGDDDDKHQTVKDTRGPSGLYTCGFQM